MNWKPKARVTSNRNKPETSPVARAEGKPSRSSATLPNVEPNAANANKNKEKSPYVNPNARSDVSSNGASPTFLKPSAQMDMTSKPTKLVQPLNNPSPKRRIVKRDFTTCTVGSK